MKAKVVNKELEDYETVFQIRRMNFDQAVINYPTGSGLKTFQIEDIELIPENNVDEFLISNKQFLKIKLTKGISVFFYMALLESLEDEIDEKVIELNVLKDKYKINRRGIWDKEILIFVNNKFPIEVLSSGQNFKKEGYSININKISEENFLNTCFNEINRIEKEIKDRNRMLSGLGKAINELKGSYNSEQKLLI
ncbi:hypothetical protein FDA33_13365 [Clostridium botulinum]|uniref:hypothetical protein n=1 Tax=Clostridium botulinum TaxID=1491 RepID=UPI0013F0AD61|nr:hypothetical protein [Clostridium botulinum]MBY6839202.1 hypothetical protein [Clostridium botulinum]MBY6918104.1 hypothetical protein [Clostridium botulinum]NFG64411.1 hypothetical protein [Clostridium botulinum]NFH91176.1 hypothetical protein [Clostridium botulinum]NFI17675.1 hypothetical protein [Clostridium botulinum]